MAAAVPAGRALAGVPVVAATSSGGVELNINGVHGYMFEAFGDAEPLLLLDVSIKNGSRREAMVNAFGTFELVAKTPSGDLTFDWDPYDPADVRKSGSPVRCSGAAYPGGAYSGTTLDHATLAPGESRRGMLVFNVPQICDWKAMRLVYRPYAVVRTNEMSLSLVKFSEAADAAAAREEERKRTAAQEKAAAARAEEDARRDAAVGAIAAGDAAAATGDYSVAITLWEAAKGYPGTSAEAVGRISRGWGQLAAKLADGADLTGAAKALGRASDNDTTVEIRGRVAKGLLSSDPDAAARLLADSLAAREKFSELYREALIATADADTSCSDSVRVAYRTAHSIGRLTGSSAERAASCEADDGSALADRKGYSAALDAYELASAYSPNNADVAALRRDLSRERSNKGLWPGLALVAAGGGAATFAILRQGSAQTTADELRAGSHSSKDVEALIAEGEAAQLQSGLLAGGAVALIGTGVGVIVVGGGKVPDALKGVQLSVAPAPMGAMVVLSLEVR